MRRWAILLEKPTMGTDRNLSFYSGIIPVSLSPSLSQFQGPDQP